MITISLILSIFLYSQETSDTDKLKKYINRYYNLVTEIDNRNYEKLNGLDAVLESLFILIKDSINKDLPSFIDKTDNEALLKLFIANEVLLKLIENKYSDNILLSTIKNDLALFNNNYELDLNINGKLSSKSALFKTLKNNLYIILDSDLTNYSLNDKFLILHNILSKLLYLIHYKFLNALSEAELAEINSLFSYDALFELNNMFNSEHRDAVVLLNLLNATFSGPSKISSFDILCLTLQKALELEYPVSINVARLRINSITNIGLKQIFIPIVIMEYPDTSYNILGTDIYFTKEQELTTSAHQELLELNLSNRAYKLNEISVASFLQTGILSPFIDENHALLFKVARNNNLSIPTAIVPNTKTLSIKLPNIIHSRRLR